MNVRVRVPNQLRDLTGGDSVVRVNVVTSADGSATLAAVLDARAATHPALERPVRDELGQARPHVNLFVDSDNVRDREGLATPIGASQELSVLPAVSGG